MSETTAADFFAARVAEYDSFITRGCPRYGEMLDELSAVLPVEASDVLELGCGTGSLTVRLAERYPDARLVVVDGAAGMVDVTRMRVTEGQPAVAVRSAFIATTFEEMTVEPESFDLVTSSMALHHIADKQPFYASLREALRRGGRLAFADELVVNDPVVQQRYWDWWLEFARRPGSLSDAEIEDCIEHMNQFDRYETLPRQLEKLSLAGFEGVDCVWRFLNYGVFVAARE